VVKPPELVSQIDRALEGRRINSTSWGRAGRACGFGHVRGFKNPRYYRQLELYKSLSGNPAMAPQVK
jgi:hypothetical protein